MKRILIGALLATTLIGAAQAQTANGSSAGGPGRGGSTPGQIVPEQRTYLRTYVGRQSVAPVTMQERVVPGFTVPAEVALSPFSDDVYAEVPSARSYRYFSTGGRVVLVDPVTRQVVDVID